MVAIIQSKLMVENFKGQFDFENFTCNENQDMENEYLKYRFMQEDKGIRLMPLSISIEDSFIRRWEDEEGHIIKMGALHD